MTYADIRDTYAWALKQFPGINCGGLICAETFDAKKVGTCETIHYAKIGSRWSEIARETEDMTAQYYLNGIDAIPFFRNLGGTERTELSYTCKGYMPTKLTSTSPDKKTRTVRIFRFN